jgi:hypothetical protein
MGQRGAALVGITGLILGLFACGDDDAPPELTFVAATFNTGTTPGLDHDATPDDGYTSAEAALSDMYYGDGLAWVATVEAARNFFADVQPDVVGFQEIFYSGECPDIPSSAYPGFVCESWTSGDPTVAQVIVGAGYQVACHPGKSDKCLAVKRGFGSFRGCTGDFCLEGLAGTGVSGCGSGARIARGVIDLVAGGSITVVNIHGSSGLSPDDRACRVAQFDQVFVDLGDGEPGANGTANVVLGDLNTDPGRLAASDASAARFDDFVGEGKPFHFITEVGEQATPSYQGVLNIDHVASDVYRGSCWAAGVSDGHPAITDIIYFDHKPVVCTVEGDLP